MTNAKVLLGENCRFTALARILCHEPGQITLGDHCLIASGAVIASSDMHSIIDVETGVRLNPAKDITIGDRVWLGDSVYVLKGAQIGAGSILGARALVQGAIGENCLAVGVPARVVKTGVTWRRELI